MNDDKLNKNNRTVSAVIDRFEGDKAVLLAEENGGSDCEIKINFPRCLLPQDLNLKEGDYIFLTVDYDGDGTEKAKKEAQELLASLKKR